MRHIGLGRDDDIRAVTRGTQRNRLADAAAAAADEERLAGQGRHSAPP
jgi:hypothetical protein